ncbi:EAL domain-containing protein [Shewanella sediminis]|nr:EAL domain-containing protein [Shewanella sediminis]
MKIIITLLLTLCIFGQAFAVEESIEPTQQLANEQVSNFTQENHRASILLNSETYSVPEGLSQSTVTSLVEDEDGYVWIGTLNGLNRFDGKEFKHYFADETSGLPSSFIRSLLIDKKGNLLVGTDKGLAIYNDKVDNFVIVTTNSQLEGKSIWSLLTDHKDIIVGTENSIVRISNDMNNISILSEYPFGGIKNLLKHNGSYIVRTYDEKVISIKQNVATLLPTASKDLSVWNDTIYSTNKDGLFSINKSVKKINNISFDSISSNHDKLVAIKNNNIYTISNDNSHTYVGEVDTTTNSFNRPKVYIGQKSIYIAIQGNGFVKIQEQENLISNINTDKNVWSINKISDNFLVSSDSENLILYDNNFNTINSFNTSITGPKSAIVKNNDIFVGTSSGLLKMDINGNGLHLLNKDKFFIVKDDKSSEYIYAGTVAGSILKFNTNNSTSEKFIIDQGNPIFDILVDDNSIWIATQGGLIKKTGDIIEPVFTEDLVGSLYLDNDDLYFGTRTGIFKYNLKSKIISNEHSNNRPIYAITKFNNYIIASSVSEVIILDLNSKLEYALTTNYGSQIEYNIQSIASLKSHIYIGGTSGVSRFSIDDLFNHIENREAPETVIDKLLIFNTPQGIGNGILKKQLKITESIKLKYSDYPFTLNFHTPGDSSSKSLFSYQMLGLSDAWLESKGINSATYTNLSPGEYSFNVYAIDPLTLKKGVTKSLKVIITPPWWLSTQAKFIYLMLALIISGAIVKAVLRRREVQNQIAKSEERLKLSLWGSGDEMWDWDIETGQIYRSNIWGSLEFPRDGQRSGENGEESNIHPMDQERVSSALNNHFYGKTDHFEAAYRVKGKSDEWVWILDRAKIVERDENDNALRMTGTIKNINNFKHAEEQLRLFERAIANISEGMFILDSNFHFVEVNEACCELSMTSRDQFIGKQLNFDRYPESYSDQIRSILHQQGSWSNEVESAKGDGSSFLMELTVDAIYDELGQLSHYVGVFSDISRRKQQEEELRKLTNNDLLTNLPNRSSLMVTLGNLVKRDSHHTLMVLDLDNFKKINDSLGHQVGDELLIKVAKRIEDTVPFHTSIYRLGGDEFAILVDNNPDIGSSAVIANKVIDAFVSPFELTSDKVVVGLSIGIVLYPEDDQNEQALLRKADIAMYHAKSGGGNRYQFYSESLNRNAIRQLEVENLIREGLRDDLFEVYYQPKIDLKSGKMAGMEALVRLNHPEQGLIPPSEFIPLAEENGLIVEIGDLVMKKACFAAQKWRSQGIFDGRVAVNLSSYQFALPDLQQRIESILRLTQLPAANLELEITEGTVIKQPEKAIKVMQQLAKMGVSLALDDFGTGYSSLSYLKRFPIHTLKIDKAFVDDIDKSDRDLKMVDSIITIAHNMGLSVVGEGVEDASQLSILKALKCEEIQGFIFSRAVTESQFTTLLHKEFIEPDLVQKSSKAM